jgi:ABC-type nitrate/sulfonate/bicarbonate transport system substrate-binding protein
MLRLSSFCISLLLVLAASAAAAPGAPAAAQTSAAQSAPATMTHVVVSYPDGGGHLPLYYAKDMGIFARHGLDVDFQPLGGGPPSVAALVSGQTQIADTTGTEVANAIAGGADSLRVIGTLVPVFPYVFEVSPDINSTDDLRGRKIAVRAKGDATDIATRLALKNLGLDPDNDVQILTLDQAGARMAALQTSQLCCTMAQPQDRLVLERQGFHALFDLTSLNLPNSQGAIAVQKTWADANQPVVQQFIDATVESIGAVRQDRAGAVAVLKKYLEVDDDQLAQATYDFFVGQVIPSVPTPSPDQFTSGISVLADTNERLVNFDMSGYLDPSYVQSAQARGLTSGP